MLSGSGCQTDMTLKLSSLAMQLSRWEGRIIDAGPHPLMGHCVGVGIDLTRLHDLFLFGQKSIANDL